MHYLQELVMLNKSDEKKGIYSVCSANKYVISAAMEKALDRQEHLVIEATANQVNQFGGYTGMKPKDFYDFVLLLAKQSDFPEEKLILGGDHLGPLTWANEPEDTAMEKAEELVRQFACAGYSKIHLDTSMRLADDDPSIKLSDETIASRGARLAKAAENGFEVYRKENPNAVPPVYIIGSEVPIPGGSQDAEEDVSVTSPENFVKTISVYQDVFTKNGLIDAWERVIGVVVQPGVEFGDEFVSDYDREKAKELTSMLKLYPNIVFECHSTDYQTREGLQRMVEDGMAILKVGPALTFGLREGLTALAAIEKNLLGSRASEFLEVLKRTMLEKPNRWKNHYHLTGRALENELIYSYLDRCRYYLPEDEVDAAINKMLKNLSEVKIPMGMISQYFPNQYWKIRKGILKNDAEELLKDRVKDWIDDYEYAAFPPSTAACVM